MGQLSRWPHLLLMNESDDTCSTLTRLAAHGQQVLAGAGVGVWLHREGSGAVTVGSGEPVVALQQLELTLGEGPSVLASTECRLVTTDDDAGRFPAWLAAARDAGIVDAVSVPMIFDHPSSVGAVTVCRQADDTGEVDRGQLVALAAHAVVVLDNLATYWGARAAADALRADMAANSVIEQAKGVLMVRERISSVLAGEYLARTSATTGREIGELAAELVAKAAAGTLR